MSCSLRSPGSSHVTFLTMLHPHSSTLHQSQLSSLYCPTMPILCITSLYEDCRCGLVCLCLFGFFFSYAEKFSVVTIIYTKIKKSLSRSIQVQTKPKENQSRGFVLVSAMVGNRAVPSMSAFQFLGYGCRKL